MALGFSEILIIVFAVLLIFGAGKVPGIMEDLGKGINSFKKGLHDGS